MLKKHFFTLPESFDPGDLLPRYLDRRHDDARYLVSTIVRKMLTNKLDGRGCANLSGEYLRNVMNKHDAADVIKELINHGAIQRFSYLAQVHCYGYRLGDRFVSDSLVQVEATDKRLIDRLNDLFSKEDDKKSSRITKVHEKLREMATQITIEPEAYKSLSETPKPRKRTKAEQELWKTKQRWMIDNIREKKWTFGVGSTGRVFTNMTNLSKQLRPFVRLNGQTVNGHDFQCFQPALLGQLLQNTLYDSRRMYTNCESKSTDLYIELVQSGEYNRFMQQQVTSKGIVLRNAKKRNLVDVLAKKGRYDSKFENLFRELFPEVYRFIKEFNQKSPSALIRHLQRMESDFMVNGVASDLLSGHPEMSFLTLHDALYVASSDGPKVDSAFRRGCDKVSFPMSWKGES